MTEYILVEIHSYHFPFSPSKVIPFYGGAASHDYHHYAGGRSQSNFASLFTYCDYKTDKVSINAFILTSINTSRVSCHWHGYKKRHHDKSE